MLEGLIAAATLALTVAALVVVAGAVIFILVVLGMRDDPPREFDQ